MPTVPYILLKKDSVTCLNNDGTFRWRTGKNASISWYGNEGTGDGEFQIMSKGISINPSSDGTLCCRRKQQSNSGSR